MLLGTGRGRLAVLPQNGHARGGGRKTYRPTNLWVRNGKQKANRRPTDTRKEDAGF